MKFAVTAVLLFLFASTGLAQEKTVPATVFADPLVATSYHVNLTYDVRVDSADLGLLPRLALIERIVVVVDTQITQIDSLRLSLRGGQQPLLVLASGGGDEIYQAGTIWTSEPLTTTGASEDRLVLHFHSPAYMDGHFRLFIFWRRLF